MPTRRRLLHPQVPVFHTAAAPGFSLVELLLVLAVASVLLGIAAPPFMALAQTIRLTSISTTLLMHLHQARSEAIKRNARVVLCKSHASGSCASTGAWEQGWLVFEDLNNNGVLDADETVIAHEPALPAGYRLQGNGNVGAYVSYAATGETKLTTGAFQAGTLVLCRLTGELGETRHIVISSTGRARLQTTRGAPCA